MDTTTGWHMYKGEPPQRKWRGSSLVMVVKKRGKKKNKKQGSSTHQGVNSATRERKKGNSSFPFRFSPSLTGN
jgi:hypothetical protein